MKVSPLLPIEMKQQMPLALFLHALPIDAVSEEENEKVLSLDLTEHLLRHPQDSFATYARDESLSSLGIQEGDLLLVDRKLKPQHGNVVIVSLDGELRCRVLDMKESCLRCDDEEQAPLLLNEYVGLMVEGVVVQSVRQFR